MCRNIRRRPLSTRTSLHNSTSLAARLKQREIKAFEELYNTYSAALFSFIFSIVKEPAGSDKVLKQVFIRAFSSITEWDMSKSSLFSWLLNMARIQAIEEKKAIIPADRVVFINPHLFNELITLRMMAEQLSEPSRSILQLAYFENMTDAEIAISLELPQPTVKSQKNQGLVFLNKIIARQQKSTVATC